jgi:hypothetical protein
MQLLTGSNGLWTWESMVSRRLRTSSYIRADLASPKAWTLHSHDHSEDFVEAFPRIIHRVEQGWFPRQQAGRYDLQLEFWKE